MQTDWRARAVDATSALSVIEPGDRVFVGTACGAPAALLSALEGHDPPIPGVRLVQFVTSAPPPEIHGRPFTRYPRRTFFVGSDTKDLVAAGKAEYVPMPLPAVPEMLARGRLPLDAALVQVSPPDADGQCSLGVSVDVTKSAIEHAAVVIAEVNPHMPRTRGDTLVPIERLDHLVEVDTPLLEYVHPPVGDAAQAIARYVARIINDGSTLQIGMGRIPHAMLAHLTNRRDLGVHSAMLTDAVLDLLEAGIVTGAKKPAGSPPVVASWAMGTRRLYDALDEDDRVALEPIDRVCAPAVLAAQHQQVSVTQAFAIDLTGQVVMDQLDGVWYGGVATQPAFHRAATQVEGGKAIVCLSSTDAAGGSRIRPALTEDDGVGIPRAEVHHVVTEYGAAYLFGTSIRERAVALIEIAHPDHREELLDEARARGLVPEKQRQRSRTAYPVEEERTVELRDGARVLIRPARTADAPGLQALFHELSSEDVRTRFFTNLASLSDDKAQHLTSVTYDTEMAFVVTIGDDEAEEVVATSSYYTDEASNRADVAYMIRPDFQGRGLGTALQDRTIEYARSRGLRGFTASVLTSNRAMLALFERSGCRVESRIESGVYEIVQHF